MTTTIKQRAKRNRTVTVSEEEKPLLEQHIHAKDFILDNNCDQAIINADLMECLDLIPDKSFQLIIIDPPYNISKSFNGFKFNTLSPEEYEDYLRSWFFKICTKLTDNGTLYMCGDWRSTYSMQKVISEKLTIINRITWQREKGRGALNNWKNGMEDIWMAVKNPTNYYFNVEAVKIRRKVIAPYKVNGVPKDWEETDKGNFRITFPSNFWDDISIPFWSMPENTDHPTQKPEKLIAKLILASSEPGDCIFDPFLGSGTSAVVAKKLGRKCLGIELSHEYCLWAAKRLSIADTDSTIQGYSDGVFWERNSLNEQKRTSKKSSQQETSNLFTQTF